jgi:capsule polysaccharide export protein KpsE/RkpR
MSDKEKYLHSRYFELVASDKDNSTCSIQWRAVKYRNTTYHCSTHSQGLGAKCAQEAYIILDYVDTKSKCFSINYDKSIMIKFHNPSSKIALENKIIALNKEIEEIHKLLEAYRNKDRITEDYINNFNNKLK